VTFLHEYAGRIVESLSLLTHARTQGINPIVQLPRSTLGNANAGGIVTVKSYKST